MGGGEGGRPFSHTGSIQDDLGEEESVGGGGEDVRHGHIVHYVVYVQPYHVQRTA